MVRNYKGKMKLLEGIPQGVMTFVSVLVQITGFCLASFIIYVFMGQLLLDSLDMFWMITITLGLGAIIWAWVLFKTPMFEWWFIEIQPNTAVVLSAQINLDQIPSDVNERTEMFKVASLREVRTGTHGKLPWEVVVAGINTKAERLIGNDASNPLEVYTKDDIQLMAEWQDILVALAGFGMYLLRHTEDQIISFFRSELEQFLIGWFKSKTEKEIFADLAKSQKDLAEEFKNVFGGPNVADKRERDHGVFTGTPQFKAIKRGKTWQDAAQSKRVLEAIGDALPGLTAHLSEEEQKNIDPNLKLFLAAAAAGQVKGEPIFLFGLPKNLDSKAAAALLGGVKGLRGGKKGD